MRTTCFKLSVCTVLMLASVPLALAQTGPTNPPGQPASKGKNGVVPSPKQTTPNPAQNRLTPDRLANLLRNDGHQVEIRQGNNGAKTVIANIMRDGWRFTLEFDFTPDGNHMDLMCPLGTPNSQFSHAQLFGLLKKSYELPMPMRFSYRNRDQQLLLEDPNYMTSNFTDEGVRKVIDRILQTVQQTYPVWNTQNWPITSQPAGVSMTNPAFNGK